jgi:hypothetical protein
MLSEGSPPYLIKTSGPTYRFSSIGTEVSHYLNIGIHITITHNKLLIISLEMLLSSSPLGPSLGTTTHDLTLCRSYLNPYCMGRKTAFFQRAFKFM